MIQIRHRETEAVLHTSELATLREAVIQAVVNGAHLNGADLIGANLNGANLNGAHLNGANLIDAGQDRRGYRFWAWRGADGTVVYRGGCREWLSFETAQGHFGPGYASDGSVDECLARLEFLFAGAKRRGWISGPIEKCEVPA